MPNLKLIPSVNGAYGEPLPISGTFLATNDVIALECVVASGATVSHGDAVSLVTGASADAISVQRSVAANDKTFLGVAMVNTADASVLPGTAPVTPPTATSPTVVGSPPQMLTPIRVAIAGVVKVNVAGNAPAVGDILATSVAAGVFITNNAATVGQSAGICIQVKDGNNQAMMIVNKS